MGTRSGLLGWEKHEGEEGYGQGEEDQEECDVGLGLRMQPNNNHNNDTTTTTCSSSSTSSAVFPIRKSMEASLHSYPNYFGGDYGSAAYGGSAISQFAYPGLGSCATTITTALHHPLSFSGKIAASSSGNPFTAAQWEELERQNMILKHMMTPSASSSSSSAAAAAAAAPVPPELLLPISIPTTKSFSSFAAPSHPNRSGGDPEPWRCRRTDGKKWRCSRDVAPHQKYCERHSHKNRPRSRKPVEFPLASAAAATVAAADYLLDLTKTATVANGSASTTRRSLALRPEESLVDSRQALSSHFDTPYDQDPPSSFSSAFASSQSFNHPRCLDWFMKGETLPSSNPDQQWHHQNDSAISGKNNSSSGGSGSNMDPFQLKQSSHYSTSQHSSLFLMEGAVDPGHSQQTRRFIDAWSNVDDCNGNRAMSGYEPSLGKSDLATSSLTLTMSGGEGDEYINRMGEKPHWMNAGMLHHGSWMSSPPGGPLAEALCLGSIAGGGGGGMRYQNSPRGCSSVTTAANTSSRSSSKDEGQEEFNFIG